MREEPEAYELMEEYLREVRTYLPEDIADDIIEELRTHIMDKATEMGGMTVRNIYRIIRELGDPRELAGKYVIGSQVKRKLTFEFGISEDLYPYFVKMVFWGIIVLTAVYSVRIIQIVFQEEFSLGLAALLTLEMIIIVFLWVFFLYAIMSFFSSNPDLKEMLMNLVKEFLGEPKREYVTEKIKPRPRTPQKSLKTTLPTGIRISEEKSAISYKPSLFKVVSGLLWIILAYIIYVLTLTVSFNWLMSMLMALLIIYFGSLGIINITQYLYENYSEKKSYIAGPIKSTMALIFIVWLILANIYTEEIQLLIISHEEILRGNFDLTKISYSLVPLPSPYIPLIKIMAILIIIIILTDTVINWLKYLRTMPKKRAEEILLSHEATI
ncbi:MAG: HAAS signaling domain-containing protein [Candidatus Njordarchaeales archaeon]